MKLMIDTVYISKCYAAAIVNNDYTGLSDQDIKLIDNYMQLNKYCGVVVLNPEDHTNFKICNICKLFNDCYEVKFYIKD